MVLYTVPQRATGNMQLATSYWEAFVASREEARGVSGEARLAAYKDARAFLRQARYNLKEAWRLAAFL